jgi:hypothetical protein
VNSDVNEVGWTAGSVGMACTADVASARRGDEGRALFAALFGAI